ncbi:UpxY family transcription antiterminator [Pedobacter sp. WC2423]|uniref:UpxY family transcription antiterminator n=1 Tax=Pedobacter sp. WC2423 TaxID=3234142 RepID=UPI003466A906
MGIFHHGWYVIYTRPQRENKISNYLSQKGIEFFFPTIKDVRQWNDRKKVISKPLFPSYIFVKIYDSADYFNCLEIDGVCYFVKFGKQLGRISQDEIDQLKIMVNYNGNIEISDECFQSGQKLQIEEGILAGLKGEMVKYNGKAKILIRTYILNRNILVDLSAELCSAIA